MVVAVQSGSVEGVSLQNEFEGRVSGEISR